MPNPATPLDLEPAIYKGLGATALLRTLIAAGAVWLVPSIVAAVRPGRRVCMSDGIHVLRARSDRSDNRNGSWKRPKSAARQTLQLD